MTRYAHIIGWGSYAPERVLTNAEIAETVDTNDEWILARTGISTRRIAGEKETTATLAFEAAARAILVADVNPADIDMIIVATSTPEYVFPASACRVQDYLGANNASAFDLSAACTGFIYGVELATNAIKAGSINTAVVIGSETLSRVVDWEDRGTCILFGDGAGAVVLRGSSVPGGVLSSILRSDGSGGNLLSLPAVYHNPVPSLGPEYVYGPHLTNTIKMNGRQVFRFAVKVIGEAVNEAIEKAGLTMDDIALIVPHQANSRIIEAAAKRMKISPDKFFTNLHKFGNTSAASIPLALVDAVSAGRLQPDDNVVFVGFGGGLTWGANVIKWGAISPSDLEKPASQWGRARYVITRTRSRIRKLRRKAMARILGTPTPDAPLDRSDRRKKHNDD